MVLGHVHSHLVPDRDMSPYAFLNSCYCCQDRRRKADSSGVFFGRGGGMGRRRGRLVHLIKNVFEL